MNKAEKKFRLYAVLSIFVLLTVLLAIINCVIYTMITSDADEITQEIADLGGSFSLAFPASQEPSRDIRQSQDVSARQGPLGRFGPMGPTSPDIDSSIRYFTFAFSPEGETVQTVAFEISAVSQEEAEEWAASLLSETTGWTSGTYRYRVYEIDDLTYITVIDQGRELLSFYRVLIISAIGDAVCLLLAFLVLTLTGKRLFAPLEEADRKQKKFIANANKDFRLPLTIISAETELLEKAHGPSDLTRSIHRQVHKMGSMVSQLDSLAIFEADNARNVEIEFSDFLLANLDQRAGDFAARGLALEADIEPDITLSADPDAIKRTVEELMENALKYARTRVSFLLKKEADRVIFQTSNDTDLPSGAADQIFDRFTKLENGAGNDSAGLGLAYVKEIVKAHAGRASASVADGIFTLRIAL